AHDLDRLVDCFSLDYVLSDPVHPARSFVGSAQVRKNWGTLFEAIPDLRLEVQQHTVTDTRIWLEAAQTGTRRDGLVMYGQMVFIAAVSAGRIASAHVYVAPVEPGGPGIDAVMAAMAGRPAPRPVAEAAGGRS
ncbi:MAG: nuclear transport factor 2 family protein, partial [Lapillicoccus sp.]